MRITAAKLFSIFLVLNLLLPGCARNPVTGQRQLVLISEAQEIAYGREAHPQILAEYGRTDNAQLQAYLGDIGQHLAKVSHRPELEWHFTVVDIPIVNAFALPGGYIYFTRQILAYMNTEAELASVVGHEIGHVTARHAVTQMSRQQLMGLSLGLGAVFSPTVAQFGDLAGFGLGLLSLKYSRDHERQSDQLGIEYMTKAGFDPRQMSGFFQVFERMQEESGQRIPNWLSSHPAPPDRIEATRREAETAIAANPRSSWTVNRDRHLQMIDGLVYGENPREGFFENGHFLHPDLRFRLTYPQGWNTQNNKRSVLFGEPRGSALVALTLADAPRGTSPEDFARRIANQPGVRLVEGGRRTINGKSAFLGVYLLEDASGTVIQVMAAFISHGGELYQIVGMTARQAFRQYASIFERTLTSFADLTDSRALNVQPDRIRIRTVRAGETIRDLAAQMNNPRVNAESLSLLNRIGVTESIPAGTRVKVVEPGRR